MESLLGLTDVFDPESLARTLTTLAEVDLDTPIRAAEVKALSPEAIKKTESAYYEPYEETQRESLVEKVGQARGKVQTGGFAGSGEDRQDYQELKDYIEVAMKTYYQVL